MAQLDSMDAPKCHKIQPGRWYTSACFVVKTFFSVCKQGSCAYVILKACYKGFSGIFLCNFMLEHDNVQTLSSRAASDVCTVHEQVRLV